MRKYLAIQPVLPSFLSEGEDLRVREWMPVGHASGMDRSAPDIVGMARWGMRYLLNNPQRPLGYECRANIYPLNYPPAPADDVHDPSAIGDTESRMELAFVYMRDTSGVSAGKNIEDAIRSRLLSYIRDDGLCWCSPRSLGEKDPEPAAMPWTTGHLLRSSAERYLRTGDEREHQLCRQLVKGLERLASRRGDLMWYEGGLAAWRRGVWLSQGQDYYPPVVSPLFRYWQVSGEPYVLEFAEKMAEGIVRGAQESLARIRVAPDGSHRFASCHLTMHGVLGVTQIGAATGNSRYLEWARRVYEYMRANGTDWGWYAEGMRISEAHNWAPTRYWSETCVTAGMVECAVALAQAGYPEYWDHVERVVRNYLPESQFFLTPEFVTLYRKVHADRPPDADRGLSLLQKFEGGFLARQRPNDWVYRHDSRLQMSMQGCCPPEGMRCLYAAWANTIVERDGEVYINMALNRETTAARVTTHAPRQGTLVVEVRKPARYYVRPPSWAPQEDVRTLVNGREVTPDWRRSYLRFRDVKIGDELQIDYPLPLFTQRVSIGCEYSEEFYEVRWVGNDIEQVSPRGQYLPIFAGSRRPLPPLPNEEDRHETPEAEDGRQPDGLSEESWTAASRVGMGPL